MFFLVLLLHVLQINAYRFDNVDCTVLINAGISRTKIVNVAACLTSLTPNNFINLADSYCASILSNNTHNNLETTLIPNDNLNCLVMSTNTFDAEECSVTYYNCYDTSFALTLDCEIDIDCRPNRPPITENTMTMMTSTYISTIVPKESATSTMFINPNVTSLETITITADPTTEYETMTITSQPTATATETVTITASSTNCSTNKCCWDENCMWFAQPNEWCAKTKSRCNGCGGYWF